MNDEFSYMNAWAADAVLPPKRKPWAKASPKLLISAAVFGAVFSYLFAMQNVGLNLAIAVLLVYGFAYYNRKQFISRTFRQECMMYLFTLPVVFLAVLFFAADTQLNVLNILVIMLVLFVQYIVLSGNAVYSWDKPGFLLDMIHGAINRGIMSLGLFSAGVFGRLFKDHTSKKKGVLVGVGIGLALLILVVPILVLADANVSRILNDFFYDVNIGDVFIYLFLFLFGATVMTGPVASARSEAFSGNRIAKESEARRPVQGVTTGIALSMIGVVYVLFAVVQFQYFFLPQQTIADVLGLTSSAYAVRGFGELIFITCLNFGIIALALRFTAQKNEKTPAYIKAMLVLLVVFNFVIMASSHLRMQCYEQAYGYTVLRFLSHSFMILLLLLNGVMLARIFSEKVKAIRLFIAAALLFFCTIVAVNPERVVARENIQRYTLAAASGEDAEIDMQYLFSLSADALIDACDFAQVHPELFDAQTREQAQQRLDSYKWMEGDWQSLNLSRIQAGQRLEKLLS